MAQAITEKTFSFGGFTNLTEQDYLEKRHDSELRFGSRFGLGLEVSGDGESTIAAALLPWFEQGGETTHRSALTLLTYGREWISYQSYTLDRNRRREGSKSYEALAAEFEVRFGLLADAEAPIMKRWPNLHHKEIRVLAGMVADAVDNGLYFNPSPALKKIIDVCEDEGY